MAQVQQRQGPYSFTQQPQAVSAQKKSKYRDPFTQDQTLSSTQSANIMWDKRVYRGNTYAAQITTMSEQTEVDARKKRQTSERRRRQEELRHQQILEQQQLHRVETPRAVEGRQHIEVQTERYLEEITDRVIETDQTTQTDPFMDRPESPLFIPSKCGVDKTTQIEEDLFEFDHEVEPLLEILVGKTVEQALMEVMEEEELENMKRHQREFAQKRNAELAETQRLEAEERRRFEEKERRKQQERERLAKEQQTKEKLASAAFAKSFLRNMETKVFTELEEEGFFFDQVEREIETDFMPWLVEQVQSNLQKRRSAKAVVDSMIRDALKSMLQKKYEKIQEGK